MISDAFIESFAATLFSMLNPIGSLGIFAGMTAARSAAESRKIAITCATAVAITLLIVNWLGNYFLHFFGISIASLQAAGGVIVLMIGLNMLFNKFDHKTSDAEIHDSENRDLIAIVPLAVPIVAGPGSMATVLLATGRSETIELKLQISLVIIGLSLFTGTLFYFARPIANFIGKSGMGVVTRIMGLVLAAIAMGLFAEGLKSLFPGLAH